MLLNKTLTQFGVNALKFAYRNNYGVAANPFHMYHLVDLGLFKQKGDYIQGYEEDGKHVVVEAFFVITQEGKRVYKKWF